MSRYALLLTVLCGVAPAAQDPPEDNIPWLVGSVGPALTKAKQSDASLVFVYLWTDNPECSEVYGKTLCTDPVAAAVSSLVCLSVDVRTDVGAEVAKSHGVTSQPAMLFLSPDGAVQDAIFGVVDADRLVAEVARIRSGEGTVGELRRQVEASPDDLAMRLKLSEKLASVGATDEAAKLVASIKKEDPKALTPTCAHIFMMEVVDEVMAAGDPEDPTSLDLKPLYDHVKKKVRPKETRFEGWNLIADLEFRRADYRKAFGAWREAQGFAEGALLGELGTNVGNAAWTVKDELRAFDKRFLLELAEEIVRYYERNPVPVAEDVNPDGEALVVDLPGALELLARAHHLNGRRTKAVEALDQAIELAPGRAYYKVLRAELNET